MDNLKYENFMKKIAKTDCKKEEIVNKILDMHKNYLKFNSLEQSIGLEKLTGIAPREEDEKRYFVSYLENKDLSNLTLYVKEKKCDVETSELVQNFYQQSLPDLLGIQKKYTMNKLEKVRDITKVLPFLPKELVQNIHEQLLENKDFYSSHWLSKFSRQMPDLEKLLSNL